MRYGHPRFACAGLLAAMSWFHSRGHRVLGCCPDRLLDPSAGGSQGMAASLSPRGSPQHLPDDIPFLRALRDANLLFTTPNRDYDDSYCLRYAQTHQAFIVSNDQFRDQLDWCPTHEARVALRTWLQHRRISFTFVAGEFLPNPDVVRALNQVEGPPAGVALPKLSYPEHATRE